MTRQINKCYTNCCIDSQSIYSDEYLMHQKTRNSSDIINVVNLKHMVAKKIRKRLGVNCISGKNPGNALS